MQYETTALAGAINLDQSRATYTPANLDDNATRTAINDSIVANATSRDDLLASLGLTDTIDLTDTIADDYTLAPQIMS